MPAPAIASQSIEWCAALLSGGAVRLNAGQEMKRFDLVCAGVFRTPPQSTRSERACPSKELTMVYGSILLTILVILAIIYLAKRV